MEKEIETKIEENILEEELSEKVIEKSGKKRLTVFKTVGANFNPTELEKIEERAKATHKTPSGVVKRAVMLYLEDDTDERVARADEYFEKYRDDLDYAIKRNNTIEEQKKELDFLYSAPIFIRLIWLFTGIKKKK